MFADQTRDRSLPRGLVLEFAIVIFVVAIAATGGELDLLGGEFERRVGGCVRT